MRAAGGSAVASLFLLLVLATAPGAAADSPNAGTHSESALTPEEASLAASVPYSAEPLFNKSGRFVTRFSVPADTDWKKIYEKPEIITMAFAPAKGDPHRYLSDADVEAVFPVEAKYFFAALKDYDAYPRVSARTVYDVGRGKSEDTSYHKRVMKISGQFLGFGDSYLFVTNNYAVRLEKGSYGLKWNLEQSLDGKLASLSGSWYLKSMECDGKPCTYVRYFNRTGFMRRPPVPSSILNFFTGKNYQNVLVEFYREAAGLEHAESGDLARRETHRFLTVR